MPQLDQSVVLITGAAGGFGQELTRQLLAANSHLILTDRDLELLQAGVEQIQREVVAGLFSRTTRDCITSAGARHGVVLGR